VPPVQESGRLTTTPTRLTFFSNSSKRKEVLSRLLAAKYSGTDFAGSQSLKKLCPTRWVDSHKSLIVFKQMFAITLSSLDEIAATFDRETRAAASSIIDSITSPSFIVSLVVLEHVAALMLPLSEQLQKPQLDLQKAVELIDGIKGVLTKWRSTADLVFHDLFCEALKLCIVAGTTMGILRRAGYQTMRANYATNSPKDYYRLSIFVPYLDHILTQLTDRFVALKGPCSVIQQLIPAFMPDQPETIDLTSVLEFYNSDVDAPSIVQREVERWTQIWRTQDKKSLPTNSLETLDYLEQHSLMFPSVSKLMIIFATLPVTTATAERSFSTLRRLKSYLRATMTEER
jgi:hypothetical protein